MKFYCKECGLEITDELMELKDEQLLNEGDKEDYISKGFYFVSDGDYYTGSKRKIIINKNDLKNSKDHTDGSRFNGCCGLDGLDGPNKICLKGHEIGTEKSDCWMAHAIILEQ